MQIFVDKEQLVEVPVYVWEKQGKVEASNSKDECPKEYEKVSFFCRKPSHKDSVKIMRAAKLGQDGADAIVFQDSVVKELAVSVNDGDKAITLDVGKINDIHPSITRALAAGILELVSI